MERLRGWDVEVDVLGAGPGTSEVCQLLAPHAALGRVRFAMATRHGGQTPPGTRTLGVATARSHSVYWRDRLVGANDLLCFDSRGGFVAATPRGFVGHTLSFPEAQLAKLAALRGLPAPDELLASGSPLPCPPRAMRRVHDALARLFDGPTVAAGGLRELAEEELPGLLLEAAAAACERVPQPPRRISHRALERALAGVHDAVEPPRSVMELCRAAETNERTLRHAFRESLGVSPGVYLRSVRLNAARRRLAASDPRDASVTDVAHALGFGNPGDFAALYRRLFGEPPSATLRRAS